MLAGRAAGGPEPDGGGPNGHAHDHERRGAPRVSVLMPTHDHARFICRAVASLQAQTFADWELVVVDDGSADDTAEVLAPLAADPRVRLERLAENRGMGAALNVAAGLARGELLAYLPADDLYYEEHLATLVAALDAAPEAALAFSGVRHSYNRRAEGQIEGEALQLVQVVHRRAEARWPERDELVTDDLERMMWAKLRPRGAFVGTGRVSCEWVDHPGQRHKLLREPIGGINPYRVRYRVAHPLRFHTTMGNPIDEVERYRAFRERPPTPMAADGLKILLVGELAYNPERVLALEERGHRLYGLWMPDPYWYNTVGPVPFGHVEDLPREGWQEAVRRLRPDVVYALLNWQAVPWVRHVLEENPGVPFVWHFKEGPFICLEHGVWADLVAIHERADGLVYSSAEMRDWFHTVLPATAGKPDHVLDGDLPKREWFTDERAARLSDADGEIHTVVPGRPIGVHPHTMEALARHGVHLHFYGEFTHGQWTRWIGNAGRLAPRHLHLHGHVDQDGWVREFSRYDAGWLHAFPSHNGGDIRRADWDDLNLPARMATLAVAGLPMIHGANPGHRVATQTIVRDLDLGVLFADVPDLARQLADRPRLEAIRANVWRQRERFCFDTHAADLEAFFRRVIDSRDGRSSRRRTPTADRAAIGATEGRSQPCSTT